MIRACLEVDKFSLDDHILVSFTHKFSCCKLDGKLFCYHTVALVKNVSTCQHLVVFDIWLEG